MSRRAGFTLLEMLVALVVFGLLMAGVAQAMRYGLVAWRQAQIATATPERLAATDAALRHMFAAAIAGSLTGRADSVAFTTTLPAGAGIEGLADVALVVTPAGLMLRYGPHPAGPALTPRPAPVEKLLVARATGLRLHYIGTRPDGTQAATTSYAGPVLPLLIRLSLTIPDAPDWPDLVVAPRNF
jgi:general secretion pathway protein J